MSKTLILKGLCCANCAAKIEDQINKMPEIQSATVSLATQKLSFETKENVSTEKVLEQVKNIINQIEDGIVIVDETEKNDDEHEHSEFGKAKKIRLILSLIFFAFGTILKLQTYIEFIIFFAAYILIGGDILLKSARNIAKGQIFDENFLMSIATIGAFAIGEFPEGVAVMIFYQIGEFFQDRAVSKSRKSITELMDIRPDFANLKIGEELKKLAPTEIKIGDIIVIKAGEKIPLDGIVIDGYGAIDTSALTGESMPRDVKKEDAVLSGTINKNGLLTVKVTKEFGDSTVSKILELVQNASSKKSKTENFITKFAKYYTPVVVILAVLIAILPLIFIEGAIFSEWLNRALVFLVISCPCALVISIPLGFFGGIGGASRKGILIKGSNYLEALVNADIVVFDKTGTLTKGKFKVTNTIVENNFSIDEVIKYGAYAEYYSNHPIGLSIKDKYERKIEESSISDYQEIEGHGIKVKVDGKAILAGNKKLLDIENIEYKEVDEIGTKIYIGVDNVYAGCIIISDELKIDSKDTITKLKELGIKQTIMLTGDSKSVGEKIAKELEIDKVYCELLPNQKVEQVESLNKEKGKNKKLIFVGDGINDAPVLAMADVGVAMGGLGSDAAIEAADVVLMTDEPSKLVDAIIVAKRTRRIVWQNIVFALSIKAITLVLGAGGIATMWEAVIADVGVALIAILNSMRVLRQNIS